MNDQWLFSSFAASSLIHLALIPAAALVIQIRPPAPTLVPIELVNVPRLEEIQKPEMAPPPPKPKAQKITAPKLFSKPEIETKPLPPTGNTKEEFKEPEPIQEPPPFAALPPEPGSTKGGWNPASRPAEAEGSAAGAGNLFGQGDVGVVGGSGVEGGGGGRSTSGLGRGAKGDGAGGGGVESAEALSGLARPLGGYQVKPRYPESARRAGAQGVTLLRVKVLENGKVGDVLIDKSAGYRDLDFAAMEAVKKWLFDPARRGKEPVSVWVLLPVKFELH